MRLHNYTQSILMYASMPFNDTFASLAVNMWFLLPFYTNDLLDIKKKCGRLTDMATLFLGP